MTETRSENLIEALDEASLSRFHLRAVLVSGMGFFTDAYDLFIIGVVISILRPLWRPSALDISLLGSTPCSLLHLAQSFSGGWSACHRKAFRIPSSPTPRCFPGHSLQRR